MNIEAKPSKTWKDYFGRHAQEKKSATGELTTVLERFDITDTLHISIDEGNVRSIVFKALLVPALRVDNPTTLVSSIALKYQPIPNAQTRTLIQNEIQLHSALTQISTYSLRTTSTTHLFDPALTESYNTLMKDTIRTSCTNIVRLFGNWFEKVNILSDLHSTTSAPYIRAELTHRVSALSPLAAQSDAAISVMELADRSLAEEMDLIAAQIPDNFTDAYFVPLVAQIMCTLHYVGPALLFTHNDLH